MATRTAYDELLPVKTVVDDDGNEFAAPLLRFAGATVATSGSGATEQVVVTPAATSVADGSITAAKLAADAVTTAKILDLNVTTGKLAANAVTLAKLAQVATARFLGRTTASTGDVEALTPAQATALLDVATGGAVPVKGLLSGADKAILDGLAAGGEVYDLVTKGHADTLEAGKLNEITSGTFCTLPSLAGVTDGQSVYVVHNRTTADTAQIEADGADTINGGDGHETDATFALTEFQGRLRFQKVDGEWRVYTEGNANAASGGGTSIAQAGGSASVDASGNVEGTAADDQSIVLTAPTSGADEAVLDLGSAGGEAVLRGTVVAILEGGQVQVEATTSLAETVGSSVRTATASGANRTETYGGTCTVVATGKLTLTATGSFVEASSLKVASGVMEWSHVAGTDYIDGTGPIAIRGSFGASLVSSAGTVTCNGATSTDIQVNGTSRILANGTGIGFFAATPVAKPSALTAAVGGTINSGDATTDTEIANMRTRIGELESKLQSLGLLS
jgi:HAMP domain-containing protein